jgi:dihydrolipoamide dehydrogenase
VIHVAGEFEAMQRASKKSRHGISLTSPPSLDMPELVRWKEGIVNKLSNGVAALCKRAKVRVLSGWARFSDAKTCTVEGKDNATVTAEHVILANGSVSSELPFLPFGGPVISSSEALALDTLPKKLVVVGAGYIGLELGIALRKLGSEVTVVEALDRILPLFDAELSTPVKKWLDRAGVTTHLGATAKGLVTEKSAHALAIQTKDGKTENLPADKILVTVGRRPLIEGWGLENMAVDMSGRFVRVDDQCRTSMRNVWAIGDLVGEPLLAHKGMAQGELVAEIIAGHRRSAWAPATRAVSCACSRARMIIASWASRPWARMSRSSRANSRSRSRWARGWKTSPARFTCIRRSAKPSTKPRFAPSVTRCTYDFAPPSP